MTRRQGFLACVVSLVLLVCSLPASPVGAAQTSNYWLIVNSPPSYCGYSYAKGINDGLTAGPRQQASGKTFVFTGNSPCTSVAGILPSLPAGYLRVKVVLRCLLWSVDWVAWQSTTVYNAANTGSTPMVSSSYSDWCGGDYNAKMRVVVTSGFYVYPTGWVNSTRTTAWVTNPGMPALADG